MPLSSKGLGSLPFKQRMSGSSPTGGANADIVQRQNTSLPTRMLRVRIALSALVLLFTACAGEGPYPVLSDAGEPSRDTGPSQLSPPTTEPEGPSPAPVPRDAGLPTIGDASQKTPCECSVLGFREPPFVCFVLVCLGDQCLTPGYQDEPRCFYTGEDPWML